MTFRQSLLALSALTLSAAAGAQYGQPWPPVQPPPPVMEPWQAPVQRPAIVQPRQAPAAAQRQRAPALEPIDLPPAIEQGVDMIYIDEELVPRAVQNNSLLHDISFDEWSGAPLDMFVSMNPIYTDLRRGLVRYQQRWGDLPQIPVPAGAPLKPGSTGERVAALRTRLGLAGGDTFDPALGVAVKEFQAAHGLKADGLAGAGTIEALNRGADYYAQRIII